MGGAWSDALLFGVRVSIGGVFLGVACGAPTAFADYIIIIVVPLQQLWTSP